ncbi:hypothetical protein OG758_09805 [Streptomyces sp. NBC_01474]|uniref:hypothetical protein n=1 Tax=unclassified Streptomyces TaxID=2593676 RepID=UPI002DDC3D72|nr:MULTISPECIES: hypothetical protein [unclassified Streptomyces]WSD94429.1 hypothetical protein OG758_09805 [Streptomyces sp. NBC_01474]
MGAIELENFAFDGDLDSDLRAISCILASVAYADMEMHDQALHICERLLEEQPDLSAFPSVMMQLQASLRNAEVKKYSRALYWANSAKVKIAEFPPGGAHTLKVALDGLKYSAESNVGAMNAMLSDEFLLAERGDRPASPRFWIDLDSMASSAAVEYMSEDFKNRIRDRALPKPPRAIRNDDYISRNLYAYYLRVQVVGHWHRYLEASQRLGMERMLRPLEGADGVTAQFSQGLAYLRKGWGSRSYIDGLRLVREEGPLDALDSELQKALGRLEREVTDLEFHLLRVGAPLLRAEEADSVIRSLLDDRLPMHARRAHGWYRTEFPLWDAVAALARELADGDYLSRRIRERVGDEDSTQSFHMGKAVDVLDWSLVSSTEQENWINLLRSSAAVDGDWRTLLDSVLYEICRTGNPVARELFHSACRTELTLERSAQLVDLPDEVGADLLGILSGAVADLCTREIGRIRNQASRGSWNFGASNPALIGAALSTKRPWDSIWPAISEFLRDPLVAADDKEPVLDFLAVRVSEIPSDVVREISSDPDRLTSVHSGLFDSSDRSSGALFRFLCAAQAIGSNDALVTLLRLSSTSASSVRVEAAKSLPAARKVLGDALAIGYLMQMTADVSVFVRAQAAEMLGYCLDDDSGNVDRRLVSQRLVQMLGANGVAVPFGALRGLLRAKRRGVALGYPDISEELRKIERDHPIARVRKAARSLLD